jgi:hypothetical protein
VLGGRGQRAQVLSKPDVALRNDLRRRPCEAESQRGDVGRGRPGRKPGAAAACLLDPLLGESGLAVARRSDERPDARRRLVEQRDEARPLDDLATPQRPGSSNRRRSRSPLEAARIGGHDPNIVVARMGAPQPQGRRAPVVSAEAVARAAGNPPRGGLLR